MKEWINWKLYWLLMGMVIVSTVLGQPAITTMTGKELTMEYMFFYALPLNGIISLLTVFIGLFLAKHMNMGSPILEAWVNGEKLPRKKLKFTLLYAPIIGVVVSISTLFISLIPSDPIGSDSIAGQVPSAFESILSAFYGGMFEEITMRLFFMTLYAWFISFIIAKLRRRKTVPSKIAIWISILVAGLAFGAGHLVTASQMFALTPSIIIKIMLGNGIPGIVFGYLYWKKGLEASMMTHFTGDIVLHVIPLLFV